MNKLFLEGPCCLSGKIEFAIKLDTETEAEQSSKTQSTEDGAGDTAWPSPAALKSRAAPQFHRHHTFPESTELLVKNDCSHAFSLSSQNHHKNPPPSFSITKQ